MEPEDLLPCSQTPATSIVPILGPINPVHATPTHFLHTYFNIILSSTLRSSQSSLPLKFPQQNPKCTSPAPVHATCPAYLVLLGLIIRMIFGNKYGS